MILLKFCTELRPSISQLVLDKRFNVDPFMSQRLVISIEVFKNLTE